MLKTGTYKLTNPQGVEKTIIIKNEADQEFYAKYYGQEGYTFTELTKNKVRPRIHISDSACTACES